MKETLCNLLDNPPRDPFGYVNTKVLADYLLENGVLVPKYKIGQTFWWSSALYNKAIKMTLESIRYSSEGFSYIMKTNHGDAVGFVDTDFGTRIHFTESEAKAVVCQRKLEKEKINLE